jgi:hypothetical protein
MTFDEVKMGQLWSIWVPSRRQWLLAKVIQREGGKATLKMDQRYNLARGYDEHSADETTMLESPNLFRAVAAP